MELGMQSHGLGRGWEGLDGAGNGIPWLGGDVGGMRQSWEWGLMELQLGMGSNGLGEHGRQSHGIKRSWNGI